MGSIGGKDVAETTRRILRSIMTDVVAVRMNFAGRGGKVAIKDMKLLRVIIGKSLYCWTILYLLVQLILALFGFVKFFCVT